MKENTHTGPYPYKDSKSIEDARVSQLRSMKGFKGAKETDSEWLKKKNAVNEKIDPFYSWDTPGQAR